MLEIERAFLGGREKRDGLFLGYRSGRGRAVPREGDGLFRGERDGLFLGKGTGCSSGKGTGCSLPSDPRFVVVFGGGRQAHSTFDDLRNFSRLAVRAGFPAVLLISHPGATMRTCRGDTSRAATME